MNLDEYRLAFLAITLGLILVIATPLVSVTVQLESNSEKFSELWLLNSERVGNDFPFEVIDGELQTIFVDLANHRGQSEFYMVQVKLRNLAESVMELSSSSPSLTPSLYDFRSFVPDGGSWEQSVTFGFQDVSITGDATTVGSVFINDFVLPVDKSTTWDDENSCYYFQLFFELWRYDVSSQSFVFEDQFVGIWLNATIAQ